MNSKRLLAIVVCIVLAAGAQVGSARTAYIDFGDSQGAATGLVDGSPAEWNVVTDWTAHTFGTLADSDGADTGIELAVTTGFNTTYGDTLTGGQWNDPAIPWSVGAATHENFSVGSSTSSTGEITLSDLEPGLTYTISLISSRDSSGSRDGIYKVNGEFADVGGASGSNPFNAYTDGYQTHDVMEWWNVAPDASNEIRLFVTPNASGHYNYINAMKVEIVPEPATLSLLALGGLGALWRRRRTR